jgi:bifunctional UDP-N-acetylglucosamine pyrophosphorylase/glucosamine-1-phosphate N-acetyltransferase
VTLFAIVLAAGKGTRMRSDLAKVLHEANGRALLLWVLDALTAVEPDETVVVVGYQADAVRSLLPIGVKSALQAEQLGTAHAAEVGLAELEPGPATVLVLPGDMPLLSSGTIAALVGQHQRDGNAATVLTAIVDDPTGYGRVMRRGDDVIAIVEERDTDEEQRANREVNTSVYAFERAAFEATLSRVEADNDQGERYLTDVVSLLVEAGDTVGALVTDAVEGMGVNDDAQLLSVEHQLRGRAAAS